ncbi:MAG: response regulator transcription factor [Candidatus Marinimicrobia bacterium]|nr:response regulator transcription factor [Candidatus Neomarinimicrobiota bacterium]
MSVVLVEDNRILREGWVTTLKLEPDIAVAGDYSSCEQLLASPVLHVADVILLDIELPGKSGIEAIPLILSLRPQAIIIMVTMHEDDQHLFDAICAGAIGYLVKMSSALDLAGAIREAVAGGSPMTPNVARRVIDYFHPKSRYLPRQNELSEQDLEVLNHLGQGKSYAAIAKVMFLSVHGVRYHIRQIYEKLQVSSRGEAVAEALEQRLIRPPT